MPNKYFYLDFIFAFMFLLHQEEQLIKLHNTEFHIAINVEENSKYLCGIV